MQSMLGVVNCMQSFSLRDNCWQNKNNNSLYHLTKQPINIRMIITAMIMRKQFLNFRIATITLGTHLITPPFTAQVKGSVSRWLFELAISIRYCQHYNTSMSPWLHIAWVVGMSYGTSAVCSRYDLPLSSAALTVG